VIASSFPDLKYKESAFLSGKPANTEKGKALCNSALFRLSETDS
jgi:hypothetical protein